jgi:hypothetical protein
VNILDVGAGAATFSDEIRNKFGDKVQVYSTGLSKKVARDYRKNNELDKLHPNDLKWRSILELSAFEEFDLIIDTIGEFSYSVAGLQQKEKGGESPEKAQEYLQAVVKKLRPGGVASIASYYVLSYASGVGKETIKELEKEYNVTISPVKDSSRSLLRIYKPD